MCIYIYRVCACIVFVSSGRHRVIVRNLSRLHFIIILLLQRPLAFCRRRDPFGPYRFPGTRPPAYVSGYFLNNARTISARAVNPPGRYIVPSPDSRKNLTISKKSSGNRAARRAYRDGRVRLLFRPRSTAVKNRKIVFVARLKALVVAIGFRTENPAKPSWRRANAGAGVFRIGRPICGCACRCTKSLD